MRAPARTAELIGKGLIYTVGYPISLVATKEGLEKVKAFNLWLDRTHLFIGDGSQGDGAGLGIAVGLKGQVGRTTPLTARFSGAITFRAYQTYRLEFMQTITPKMTLDAWGQYRYRPQDNFFGIGPGARITARSNYSQSDYNAGAGIHYKGDRFILRGLIDWTDYKIGRGRNSESPSTLSVFSGLPGSGGARLVSAGVDVLAPVDLYRMPGWKTGIEMGVRTYFDVEGGTYGFNIYRLTLYQALPVLWGDRVLAVRATGMVADRHSGRTVPFFLLPRLGGSGTLRGFDNLRFHDARAFFINAEYRYPFWDIGINSGVNEGLAGDIILFMDTGMVFDSFRNDVKTGHLSTNYGVGVRVRRRNGVMGRGMIAHSSETTRIVISIGRDF